MRTKIFIVSILFVTSYCVAQKKEISSSNMTVQTKEIHFEKLSFKELKAKAKKENKLIFIDAYTSWCAPCKWMAKNVFTNDTVADYFNEKFINAKFDMETVEGIDIAKLYEVRSYPDFLFINGDGKIIHRGASSMSYQDFLKLGETAFNPKQRLSYYEEQYPQKKSDPTFVLDYLRILDIIDGKRLVGVVNIENKKLFDMVKLNKELFAKKDSLLKEYFAFQTEEMLTNRANWNAIRDFTYDYKSREFSYLLKNVATYKKLYTEDSVNSKIKDVFLNGTRLFFANKAYTEANEIAYINEIKTLNSAEAEHALFLLSSASAKRSGKWQEYMRLVMESGDKYIRSSEEKEKVSKIIYENMDDTLSLQKAEQMMQIAVKEDPGWLVYETYANVLYKLNKKNEAKLMALKAIDTAKKTGAKKENYNSITYLLEKIEKL